MTAFAIVAVAFLGFRVFDDPDGSPTTSPAAQPTAPVDTGSEVTTPSGETTTDTAESPPDPSTAAGTEGESTTDADASAPGPPAPVPVPVPVDHDTPASAALPLGTAAPIGDRYTVAMTAVDLDATELILAEDPSNPSPPPGDVYVMVTLDVRFNGLVGEAEPYFDLRVGAADDAGGEFEDVDCVALTPDDMYALAPIGPGEAAAGTFCLVVPTDATDTLTFFVEENESATDTRAWWSSSD